MQMKFKYRLTSQAVMQRLSPGAGIAVLVFFFLIASAHARVQQLCTWDLPPAQQLLQPQASQQSSEGLGREQGGSGRDGMGTF